MVVVTRLISSIPRAAKHMILHIEQVWMKMDKLLPEQQPINVSLIVCENWGRLQSWVNSLFQRLTIWLLKYLEVVVGKDKYSMSLTFEDIKSRLRMLDEITLLEILDINSEDLIQAFEDRIMERADTLEEDLTEEPSEET